MTFLINLSLIAYRLSIRGGGGDNIFAYVSMKYKTDHTNKFMMTNYYRVSVSVEDVLRIDRIESVVFASAQTEQSVIAYVMDPSNTDRLYELFDPNTGLPARDVHYASVVGFITTDAEGNPFINGGTYHPYVVSTNRGGHQSVLNTDDIFETYVLTFDDVMYANIHEETFKTQFIRANIEVPNTNDLQIIHVSEHTLYGNVIAEIRIRNPDNELNSTLRSNPETLFGESSVTHYHYMKASFRQVVTDISRLFPTIQIAQGLPVIFNAYPEPVVAQSATVLSETFGVFSRDNKGSPLSYYKDWVVLVMFTNDADRDLYKTHFRGLDGVLRDVIIRSSTVDFQNIVLYG